MVDRVIITLGLALLIASPDLSVRGEAPARDTPKKSDREIVVTVRLPPDAKTGKFRMILDKLKKKGLVQRYTLQSLEAAEKGASAEIMANPRTFWARIVEVQKELQDGAISRISIRAKK